MEFNIEIRKKQLKSLKQYIKSSEDNVQAVLHSLGWNSKKTLEKEDPKVICPINKNHLISYKTSERHLEKCTLHSSGYDSNEEYLSEPPETSHCSIKLNTAKKIEVLSAAKGNRSDFKPAWNGRDSDPMTANRLMSTFSTDERSTIYDYCIKHTEGPPKPEEFTLDIPEPEGKERLSEKEKLALERDSKRRRTKYKSVHTSKKSQTEIMREVIDNQMTLYKQWIEHKQEQKQKEREKIERLQSEKNKRQDQLNEGQQSTQYHYIETTYDQNNVTQVNQNNLQWDQSMPWMHSENYGSEYYGNVQTAQGVITDWSHVYQAGMNTNIYADSGQYQLEDGEYVEQPTTSIDSTNPTYTESSKLLNLDVLSHPYNGHSQESNSHKEYSNKIKNKEHLGLKVRFKEHSPYEKKTPDKGSRERDRRHERETRRRHRSRERRKDKKH